MNFPASRKTKPQPEWDVHRDFAAPTVRFTQGNSHLAKLTEPPTDPRSVVSKHRKSNTESGIFDWEKRIRGYANQGEAAAELGACQAKQSG